MGPWFVSIDDEPLSVLDGMSQTATLCGGFAEDPVVQALIEGEFEGTLVANEDTALGETEPAAAYANTLRELVPGLPHVTFVASGAEANEKALALARLNCPRPDARRGAGVRGQLPRPHAARAARDLEPGEADPVRARRPRGDVRAVPGVGRTGPGSAGTGEPPPAPSGFYAAAAAGDATELVERFGDADDDPLLAAEVRSLAAVHEALATGEYFACIVEPMQSRGRRPLRDRAVLPGPAPAHPVPRHASSCSTRSRSGSASAARSSGTPGSTCTTGAASPTSPTRSRSRSGPRSGS